MFKQIMFEEIIFEENEEKLYKTKELYRKYCGINPPTINRGIFNHYRMRVEYNLVKLKDNKIDLDEFSKKTLSRANINIYNLLPYLLNDINSEEILSKKLFRIDFLTNQVGCVVVTLVYHKKLKEDWETVANKLSEKYNIGIIGKSKKQEIVINIDHVTEIINLADKTLHYNYYAGLFSQPNTIINSKMLQWCIDMTQYVDRDLLELYCGSGNFSLALASNFDKVLASEYYCCFSS